MAVASTPPNRLPWPPMIYALALAASCALEIWVPLFRWRLPNELRIWGTLPIGIGLILDLGAMYALYQAKTTVLPNRSASYLVTKWPFSLSRNPIYLANTFVLLGIAAWMSSIWLFVLIPISVALVSKIAIEREEAHLKAKFGDEWESYRRRVPRWLVGI